MKKPYITVVIPTYNAWEQLVLLLSSLDASGYKQFEVIIGDDASHTEKPSGLLKLLPKKIGISKPQLIRIPVNRGPAAARNAAARRAKGEVLVFLDSDVTVYADTLKNISAKFTLDHDLTALTGVWDKHQRSRSFFPQFKALRDWSYWTNERDRDGYYYLFSTRIAAIKTDVFRRLGGFNEQFRQMEDVELTYRIAKRYAIIFAPDVRVHHEFEGFLPVAKKYFWRSFYWTRLYKERRKFDPVATTMWESMAGVTGAGAVIALIVGMILFFIVPSELIKIAVLSTFSILIGIHVLLLYKFLRFVLRERGWVFMIQSLCTGIALYCVIVAGSLYFQFKQMMR